MKAWIKWWGPAVLMMVLIFTGSAIPSREIPEFGFCDFIIKKGGHMFVYSLLSIAFFRALNKGKSVSRIQFSVAVCLSILYAISDELHQRFTPGRTSTFMDVCFDAAGAILGLALWRFIRTHRANP